MLIHMQLQLQPLLPCSFQSNGLDAAAQTLTIAFDARAAGRIFRDPQSHLPLPDERVFIMCWVDCCNKCGMGYASTDGSVSVHFNDSTSLVLSPDNVWVANHFLWWWEHDILFFIFLFLFWGGVVYNFSPTRGTVYVQRIVYGRDVPWLSMTFSSSWLQIYLYKVYCLIDMLQFCFDFIVHSWNGVRYS